MENWKTISENKVKLCWACTDEDCGCGESAETTGGWHEINGTPICSTGYDMSFIETQVAIDDELENGLAVIELSTECA